MALISFLGQLENNLDISRRILRILMILKIIIFVVHQANTIMFVMDRHHRLNLRYVKDIRLGKSCCAFNWEILDLKQKKGKNLIFELDLFS